MAETIGGDKEKIEVLTALYRIFKREVYQRREAMMKKAAFSNVVLLGLLFVVGMGEPQTVFFDWLAIPALLVFSGGFIQQIRQQKIRHDEAKEGLVRIEQALELFAPGVYLPEKSLYPQEWESARRKDWILATAFFNIIALTALVAVALLLT
jgi:hypothetical protein